jgi:hypothetical protein
VTDKNERTDRERIEIEETPRERDRDRGGTEIRHREDRH